MINASDGAFTEVLNHFLLILNNIPNNLKDPTLYLLFTLLTIDICVTFIKNIGEVGFSWIKYLIPKVFFTGFLVYLITNWELIVKQISNAFIGVGCHAIGITSTPREMKDPSFIITNGLKSGLNILKRGGVFKKHGIFVIFLGAAFCLCLFLIALQVFLTLVSFYFMCYISIIFVGFGSFHKTVFLLEKVISVLIYFGVRLMMLTLVVSIVTKQHGIFEIPVGLKVPTLTYHVILVGTLTFVVWTIPKLSASMLTGEASFSSGPLIATGLGMISGGFDERRNNAVIKSKTTNKKTKVS